MKLTNIIAGINILLPYYDDPDYNMGADHDIIYMYATDRPLSDEDYLKMVELGWFQENVDEGLYSPSESWCAFV